MRAGRIARSLVLSTLLALSGCTLSVPQLESAIVFAEEMIGSKQAKSTDELATWLASANGRGAILNPYLSNDLIVFANSDGDAIAFDGWIIRSIVGFGLQDPISISGKDGVRTFKDADRKTVATCDEWNLTGQIWSQTCSNGSSEIVLDENDNIQKIMMAIGNGSMIVTLHVAE